DVTGVEGVETAGNRGEHVSQSKGQQLVTENVDPEGLRQIFIEADRREAAADPGTQYQRTHSNREEQGDQAEEIPDEPAIYLDQAGDRNPDERLVEHHQPECAIRHAIPVEDDQPR